MRMYVYSSQPTDTISEQIHSCDIEKHRLHCVFSYIYPASYPNPVSPHFTNSSSLHTTLLLGTQHSTYRTSQDVQHFQNMGQMRRHRSITKQTKGHITNAQAQLTQLCCLRTTAPITPNSVSASSVMHRDRVSGGVESSGSPRESGRVTATLGLVARTLHYGCIGRGQVAHLYDRFIRFT